MEDPIKTAKASGRISTPIPVEGAARWAPDQSAVQDREDGPAPGSSGDIPLTSWLRGAGEDATRMPGFDRGPSGTAPARGNDNGRFLHRHRAKTFRSD